MLIPKELILMKVKLAQIGKMSSKKYATSLDGELNKHHFLSLNCV